MQSVETNRVERRHGIAHPELEPGQIVTWKDVADRRRLRRPAQGSLFPSRRSPDKQRSLERRRRLAASGPMPPTLACNFTTGELAVLRIVADEVRARGRCIAFVDELAARAGVCRRLAQGALREAERLGLVHIAERRITGTRNDSNVVTIVSADWRAWLRLRERVQKISKHGQTQIRRDLSILPRAENREPKQEREGAPNGAKESGGEVGQDRCHSIRGGNERNEARLGTRLDCIAGDAGRGYS